MSRDAGERPRYRDLPVDPGLPAGSSWGVFGSDDQVGMLNLLDEQRVRDGVALVRRGAVFPLNWKMELPDPPVLGRLPMTHTYIRLDGGFDETYDSFNPQASSQWDALCHVDHPVHGFYNGHGVEEITGRPGSALGIDKWAERGIVGPFVLIDVARYRTQTGDPIDYCTKDVVTLECLRGALEMQGSRIEPGTIVLLHFGWIEWYESLDSAERAALAETEMFPVPGLSTEPDMDEWVWDSGIAAIVADNPSVEAMPFDKASDRTFLHFRLVALHGIAFGEMHDLSRLAEDCAQDGVYQGFFTAAPMNKLGGSGSTGNALAIK
jgi:kynurenine formamidase